MLDLLLLELLLLVSLKMLLQLLLELLLVRRGRLLLKGVIEVGALSCPQRLGVANERVRQALTAAGQAECRRTVHHRSVCSRRERSRASVAIRRGHLRTASESCRDERHGHSSARVHLRSRSGLPLRMRGLSVRVASDVDASKLVRRRCLQSRKRSVVCPTFRGTAKVVHVSQEVSSSVILAEGSRGGRRHHIAAEACAGRQLMVHREGPAVGRRDGVGHRKIGAAAVTTMKPHLSSHSNTAVAFGRSKKGRRHQNKENTYNQPIILRRSYRLTSSVQHLTPLPSTRSRLFAPSSRACRGEAGTTISLHWIRFETAPLECRRPPLTDRSEGGVLSKYETTASSHSSCSEQY